MHFLVNFFQKYSAFPCEFFQKYSVFPCEFVSKTQCISGGYGGQAQEPPDQDSQQGVPLPLPPAQPPRLRHRGHVPSGHRRGGGWRRSYGQGAEARAAAQPPALHGLHQAGQLSHT